MKDIVLYVLVALSALSALGILMVRQVFYGALFLLTCLVSLAGIYLFLQAEFLAVTQLIVYAGGVLVLIVFAIMLTLHQAGKPMTAPHHNYTGGIFVSVAFVSLLSYSLHSFAPQVFSETPDMKVHVTQVGLLLFTRYVAPFEVAGLLLLISLIAAAVIASHTPTGKKP